NRNLLEEVKDGNFREDLYYRLNVLPLTVPPLRDRREDIPELLRHFIARISTEEGRSNISGIDGSAMDMLCEYDWPGNIRQLENAVFRAVVLCEGDQLTIDEFPQIAIERNVEVSKPTTQVQETTMNVVDPAPALDTPVNIVPPAHDGMTLVNENDDIIMLEEAEKKIIQFAIEKYDGRMSTIARKLGIGRSTLYRKLREYGLEEASQ
ncbi:MAG: helix-turn-helix domain-containing protein, partial [Pseudomonadota bacterium]